MKCVVTKCVVITTLWTQEINNVGPSAEVSPDGGKSVVDHKHGHLDL